MQSWAILLSGGYRFISHINGQSKQTWYALLMFCREKFLRVRKQSNLTHSNFKQRHGIFAPFTYTRARVMTACTRYTILEIAIARSKQGLVFFSFWKQQRLVFTRCNRWMRQSFDDWNLEVTCKSGLHRIGGPFHSLCSLMLKFDLYWNIVREKYYSLTKK